MMGQQFTLLECSRNTQTRVQALLCNISDSGHGPTTAACDTVQLCHELDDYFPQLLPEVPKITKLTWLTRKKGSNASSKNAFWRLAKLFGGTCGPSTNKQTTSTAKGVRTLS